MADLYARGEMMQIRRAQITDAADIARVCVDTWRTAYQGIIAEPVLADLSYDEFEQRYREALTQAPAPSIYVALQKGQLIGFAFGGPERSGQTDYSAEVYAMYVLAGKQNQGAGRRLFIAVADDLAASNHTSLLVHVLVGNPYRRFYTTMGGDFLGEEVYQVNGLDLVLATYGWEDINLLLQAAAVNSSKE